MTTASQPPLIMGIESSCDETGVAFVRGCELLAERLRPASMTRPVRRRGARVASRAHWRR